MLLPPLTLKNLRVETPLALAPMVGLSHSALRSLVIELGGAGLLFTEMLSARRLPDENEHISPYLVRDPAEWPLFYQLFVTPQCDVVKAVDKLHRLGAQGIDVNLGCPSSRVCRFGAGSALARDTLVAENIVKRIRNETDLPLSVKMRLGDDRADKHHYLDFCKKLVEAGVDCLVIHARFEREKFCRKPRWEWIAAAKKAVSVPVIANGGIGSVQDALKCLEITGADGLMIGRAAVERPWIFREIAGKLCGHAAVSGKISLESIYFRFTELLTARFRQERRLGRLKEFTHYFAASFQYGHHLASSVQSSATVEDALGAARQFFARNDNLYV